MRLLGRWSRFTRPRSLRFGSSDIVDLYALTPVGAAVLSPRGRFLRTNRALQEMLGYSEEELRAMDFEAVTYPEDAAEARRRFDRLRDGELGHYSVEKRCLRKDGELRWAQVIVTVDPSRRGRITALVLDITERKRQERELLSNERSLEHLHEKLERSVSERAEQLELRGALLAAMQETSLDGILATDLRRRVLAYNKRLLELWRAPEELARSCAAEDTMRFALPLVRDPKTFISRVIHLYTHRTERSFDEVELKDGRTLERYSGPILGLEGRPIGRVWYYRDITERKAAQRQLRERTAELSRTADDLETYAYAASHDLSAPVRKIFSYTGLLISSARGRLNDRELAMLGVVARSAARMADLIDDVQTLRRLSGDRQPLAAVDLREVVTQALVDLEPAVSEAGARVEVGELPRVLGHQQELRRLFYNLLSNAVKFHKAGHGPRVRVTAADSEPGRVAIAVSDDGIGFEPRYAEKIFRPFARLHSLSDFAGSGVGLAISRRIATACGGAITASGEPGKGAVFTVTLRRA